MCLINSLVAWGNAISTAGVDGLHHVLGADEQHVLDSVALCVGVNCVCFKVSQLLLHFADAVH